MKIFDRVFMALVVLLAFTATTAGAEEQNSQGSETKMQLKDATKGNKVGEKEQSEITNAKLRAEQGSMSKWSATSDLSYYGSSIQDGVGKERPNPDNLAGDYSTYIQGSAGVRYRFSKSTSVAMQTGLNILQPFHGVKHTDVFNPSVTLKYARKLGGLQWASGFILTGITSSSSREVGETHDYDVSSTILGEVGKSRFTLGTTVAAGMSNFERSWQKDDGNVLGYYAGIYPFAEYAFNDTFSLRSLVGIQHYHYRWQEKDTDLKRATIYQTIGLGTSITPDVYLYTFLKGQPEKGWTSERTSLNFSTSFSVF